MGTRTVSPMSTGGDYASLRDTNKAYWNERIDTHVNSEHYDADGFRAGGLSLMPLERDEVGPVAGKRLLVWLDGWDATVRRIWADLLAQKQRDDLSGAARA